MFIDQITFRVKAGNGGNGAVFFDKLQHPMGGMGGIGGDVIFRGNQNLFSLSKLKRDFFYEAPNGENGSEKNQTGANSPELILDVPLTTKIYNEENELVGEISENGSTITIAKGGRGGFGNYYFRKGGWKTTHKRTLGRSGEEKSLKLVLELKADTILLGFPNAGKSSILTSITNADAKVAPYAFTTLIPQLGRVGKKILMDLPGLIEGTFAGKGLGTRFVKHTYSAHRICHCLSLENYVSEGIAGLETAYHTMLTEVTKISDTFSEKEEFVVLTKSDLLEPHLLPQICSDLEAKINRRVISISVYDIDSLENLKKYI